MTLPVARKHPLAECEKCPLQLARCAPTIGPIDAKIALVSRSPGYYDVINGIPFSGPTKKVLDYLLQRYNHARSEIRITNVVLCETDDPSIEAIAACNPRLMAEIDTAETIIAAGSEAVKALVPKHSSVSRARGYSHTRTNSAGVAQRVVATNNPALVLRNSDAFPDLITDFRIALNPIEQPTFPKVEVIDDPSRARTVLEGWNATVFDTPIASDLEWRSTEYVCAGFAARPEKAIVFGLEAVGHEGVRRELKRFYERTDVQFIWHNGKADTTVLRKNDIAGRIDEDTFLLSYACDEEPGRHALDYLLQTEFGWPNYEPSSVKHFKKTGRFDYYGTEPQDIVRAKRELYKYNGWDTAGTYQLHDLLKARAIKDDVYDRPYRQFLVPAAEAFRTVEMRGFHFDSEAAMNINEEIVYPKLATLKMTMQALTGLELLNPNSPKQLQGVYYEMFGLKHGLKDTGKIKLSRSTGKEVRKEIIEGRTSCKPQYREVLLDFAKTHQQFAKIDKQRGTYIEGLVNRAYANESGGGKLHCQFNPAGTVTGRPSSKEPNFQNITREGVEGIPGIRNLFLPSPGNRIIQADFSQAELRTCSVLSGDKGLLAIYSDSSRSLHKERARLFYGDNYTKEKYVFSKNINFGVTYGQSAEAFAQMYAKPIAEAQGLVDSWWRQFPRLKEWTNEVFQQARKVAYTQSLFGHKRRFHLITEENINALKRESVNFLPQNIAAWLTLCAMIELVGMGVPIISTVHDSIIADVPIDEIFVTARLIKETMEAQPMKQLGWDMPFLADISIGDTWGTVEETELEAIAA